jgi:transposase
VSRQKFTKEFKEEAVRQVLDQGKTQNEVARELGIHQSALCRWVRKVRRNGKDAFPGHGKLMAPAQKVRDLEAELRRVTMERDILKKAITYFAQHEK